MAAGRIVTRARKDTNVEVHAGRLAKMKILFIMCGTAFSGKTTLALQLVNALNCAYVSLDAINSERSLFGGDGIPVREWERTHQIARARIEAFMRQGRTIVLDDTSCFRWLRNSYREFAQQNDYIPELVYLEIPPEELQRRISQNSNSLERRILLPEVLNQHLCSFEKPSVDESPTVLGTEKDIANWIGLTVGRLGGDRTSRDAT